MTKNYTPIWTKETREVFADYVSCLKLPEIDYLAIGVQDTLKKCSTSLMSLPEWQKHFHVNGYADYDPIRQITLHTQRNIIPFEEIDCRDNFGKEIMRQRRIMGIKNGLILMKRFSSHNYIVTLGTGYSQFDAFDFLKQYHRALQQVLPDLIKIIEQEALAYTLPR